MGIVSTSRFTREDSQRPGTGRSQLIAAILIGVLAAGLIGPGSSWAAARSPHWAIHTTSLPTYFKPGDAADEYTLIVMNDGGRTTDGSTVTVADALPAGLTATGIAGHDADLNEAMVCTLATLTCTFSGSVAAGDALLVTITVSLAGELPSTVTDRATASGGGAPSASASDQTTIDSSPVPFGLSYLTTEITGESGSAETQAGAHPFQMTTSLAFDSGGLEASGAPLLNAEAKDIEIALPSGLVGDKGAVPECSQATFQAVASVHNCPADTQVGVMRLFFYGGGSAVQIVPVYNLASPPGEPVELGFSISLLVHIPMFFHVRSEGDYGITVRLANISEADPLRASILTLWGVPADPSHDSLRQGEPGCGGGGCGSDSNPKPFLALPSHCQPEVTPVVEVTTDSWQSQGERNEEGLPDLRPPSWVTKGSGLPPFSGCANLSFGPSLAVATDTAQAGAPSGYTIELQVPQSEGPTGLATAAVRDTTVALPAGTAITPGGADGLQACSDEAFALHSNTPASCPPASQLGTVVMHTPLLSSPLLGALFAGRPSCDPCSPADAASGRMVRLFLQARGSGMIVKLEGWDSLGPSAGSLASTFPEDPQLPFSDFTLTLSGGPRATLANPAVCGLASSTADLRPWSWPFTPDATPSSALQVTGCGAAQFQPTLAAGTTDNQAGAFSPFTFTLTRSDSDQDIQRIAARLAPGLLGMISRVQLCEEPQAAQGACPRASIIGHVAAGAGAGADPLYVPRAGGPQNPVYLTGPYRGAPFGLAFVVSAEAGPYNLGTVVLRSAISVDTRTAQIAIASDPLPTILDGVPLHIRTLDIAIDREGFIFNPTNCSPFAIAGAAASAGGMSAQLFTRFQAANCQALPFQPSFKASTPSGDTRANGAALDVRIAYPRSAQADSTPASGTQKNGVLANDTYANGAQADIGYVKVSLPRQLPARFAALQNACPEGAFAANPATCPAASAVGTARASSPVLSAPLSGPAYLVSHGRAAFPDLVIVLQGEGVVLDLNGATSIAGGITTSTFAAIPDTPFSTFELKLSQGPHSVLAANLPAKSRSGLCSAKLSMPTTILAQNGARIVQSTRIAVSGCPKARGARARKARARKTRARKIRARKVGAR